jgi:hypothetical protein
VVWTLGFLLLIGALAPAVGLLGLAALGASRRVLAGAALASGLGFAAIPFLPGAEVADGAWPRLLDAPPEQILFLVLGLGTTASVLAVARTRLAGRWEREDVFLVGWLAIEIVGFVVLSPFLAVRRVLGVSLVALLLCGRAAARGPSRPVDVALPVAAGVLLALVFAASDFVDALAVRDSVRVAQHELQRLGAEPDGASVWFVGGWGFGFYAERAGMRPVVPGRSRLRGGDWLVVAQGLSALHLLLPGLPPPEAQADVRSASPWSTHPGAYVGSSALRPRAQAIVRLWIHRLQADVAPELERTLYPRSTPETPRAIQDAR